MSTVWPMTEPPRGTTEPFLMVPDGGAYSTECSHLYKVIVAGESAVGKSSLLNRFVDGDYNESTLSTIGVDFKVRPYRVVGDNGVEKKVKLQLWDTAGQERFRSIALSYFRGAHAIFLVYDITNRETFEALHQWFEMVHKHTIGTKPVVCIVGNKVDLAAVHRRVSIDEALEFANTHDSPYVEVSAKDNVCVDDLFAQTVRELLEKSANGQLANDKMKKTFPERREKIDQEPACCVMM